MPTETETVMITLRFKSDSYALILNSCLHFQPQETERRNEMWQSDGVSVARPTSLGMKFEILLSLQEA